MKTNQTGFNPWPVAIIATFVIFIIGLIAWITFAVHQKLDLVRADYYEEELRFQDQVDRVGRTVAWRGEMSVLYQPEFHWLKIQLPAAHVAKAPTGKITLYRPSNAALDKVLPLRLDTDGLQRLDTQNLAPGFWKVRLVWKVDAEEYYFEQAVVIENRAGHKLASAL